MRYAAGRPEVPDAGRAILPVLLLAVALSTITWAQLATGILEGRLSDPTGRPRSGVTLRIAGGAGFHLVVRTRANGAFTVVLPYGRYRIAEDSASDASPAEQVVFVAPLRTTHADLVTNFPALDLPGLWADTTRGSTYPESYSLQGILLSREPASVAEPLSFIGLGDTRLALVSQRALSWTNTQYRLHGIDATDAYQPGRPAILPDPQALGTITVRSTFADAAMPGSGTEAALFLAEPGPSWHGTLATAGTGSIFASTNLPAPGTQGLVQQPEIYRWFTRNTAQVGGPLSRWADLFASGTAQWASQTVPLAAPGNEQGSRMLFGNVRGRIRASSKDQLDALYSGSRVDLSDCGIPAALEALIGRRGSPSFIQPGGFPGLAETDHLDFVQAGWTRMLPAASGSGALQLRYGYSTAHFDTKPAAHGFAAPSSIVELLDGAITGAPPLRNLAVLTRHSVEGTWQPSWHGLILGGSWTSSSPRQRFNAPSDMNLITAAGAPAFVLQLNTPLHVRQHITSFSAFAADHLSLTPSLSLDLGVHADIARGSLPAQSSPSGDFAPERIFAAQSGLIAWNSVSPRAGFAWRVPFARGLVLRGAYSRSYAPLAGRYLDLGNPNSLGGGEYRWIDRNADGRFQPGETGALLLNFGGPFSSISASLRRPYSDQFNVGAEYAATPRALLSIHLFRRDDKDRIAAIDTGVPFDAFQPRLVPDPGPDSIPGTFDDAHLTVYAQDPSTLGQDRYLLTNPSGLRILNEGLLAEFSTRWQRLTLHASFLAEKSFGPTNPGNAASENDPGVLGALYLDPNTAIHATGRIFTDRAYVAKAQATYRLLPAWGGIELASVADYLDGLAFARRLLISGLPQGPFMAPATLRGSPEGGNRAEYVINWNLRASRAFRVRAANMTAGINILNVTNAGQKIQENDLSGPAFNLRLPVAIQPARCLRFDFRIGF